VHALSPGAAGAAERETTQGAMQGATQDDGTPGARVERQHDQTEWNADSPGLPAAWQRGQDASVSWARTERRCRGRRQLRRAVAPPSRGVAPRRGWQVRLLRWLGVLAALAVAACGGGVKHQATGTGEPGVQRGMATFYGDEQQGGPTASGERFDKRKLTAAHRTLPLGTRVRVTNTRNGRSVEVRINDRGPYGNRGRIIDISEAAARRLDMIDAGVVPVVVEVLR
jgi:rare lipoprotein A